MTNLRGNGPYSQRERPAKTNIILSQAFMCYIIWNYYLKCYI